MSASRLWALVLFERHRRGNACQRCGHGSDLHWHHVEPSEKSFNISQVRSTFMPGLTAEVLALELEKCELLCPNCHAAHHREVRERAARSRAGALTVQELRADGWEVGYGGLKS